LKIVRVIARLNVGGPARHVVILDKGLHRRGHHTLLVHGSVGSEEQSLAHLASSSGIRTVLIAELGRRINVFSDLRALVRLVTLTFREAPDVVHTHTAKAGTLGRLAAVAFNLTRRSRRRCVVVHTFHGHVLSGYFHPIADIVVRMIERTLGVVTDRIVAISPRQRDDLVQRFKVAPASRTVVIPLGLELDDLLRQPASGAPNLRERLGIPEHAIVIGYVGRFVAIKDLRTLLAAFGAALRRASNMWLILAGGGALRVDLEKRVAEAGLGERVLFLGWTDDLGPLYATVDICVLSSLNEGTPVAIIEAMAAARAVVATAVGGVPDVIDHERTGLLVPPRDASALADAFVRLATAPTERHQMGAAGRAFVAARFSSSRLVSDVDALYMEAVAEKRGYRAENRG
jgi:glycosyltransferase involved in cell wall biosynthesis